MKNLLFIVDPQFDFMGWANGQPYVWNGGQAALPVPGAVEDMTRLAHYIETSITEIDGIIVTLDTHELPGSGPDIGHPSFWMDKAGKAPAPFTKITLSDVWNGVWTPRDPSLLPRVRAYLEKVEAQQVWTRHCVDGTQGQQVFDRLALALKFWESNTHSKVKYVRKGMNPLTEQYGVFEAAVPDPADPSTQFNEELLRDIEGYSQVFVAGEALDFCVKTSVEQMVSKLSPEALPRFTLLSDSMSPVNLDQKNTVGNAFLSKIRQLGMQVSSTDQIMLAA